jgi:hypothetical protein
MPLRDHFHLPLTKRASWEELHGGWPMVIVQQLDKVLPERYVAAPRVHLGSLVEVDIAALDRGLGAIGAKSQSIISTAWSPAAPSLTVETALGDFDEYEVRVYDAERDRHLVAAVEIISPANKDRPEARSQFVARCAALLRQQVSVVMVDLVTSHHFNLYSELLELIHERDPALDEPSAIYGVSCRWRPHGVGHRLETWNRPFVIGQPLPELPLWLSNDLAIPLDLESSYEKTCRDLRIA